MNAYNTEFVPQPFEEAAFAWHDSTRQRDVPVRIYFPTQLTEPAPLIVFSHGLGSSCDGYSYLGRHWASYGYIVVHPTHVGSDSAAFVGPGGLPARRLADFLDDVDEWLNRPRDVSFVLDQIERDDVLSRQVDFARIAAAGHSYGAYTALALAGLHTHVPGHPHADLSDQRIRAAIVMSPQSQDKFGLYEQSWDRIDLPVLALTGTRDMEYGVGSAAPRRTSFDRTPGRDQYLLTISGATHATFDDPKNLRIRTKSIDPAHHEYILMATTAFLDAHLRRNPAAQQWLLSSALATLSNGACTLESKHITPLAPPPSAD